MTMWKEDINFFISLCSVHGVRMLMVGGGVVNKSFDEAYQNAEVVGSEDDDNDSWRVLAFEDLITSKIKSGRPKDLLDVYELKRRKDGYK